MAQSLPVRDAVSAGGVVWRGGGAGALEIVVCGREADRMWGLPKGTPDDGESLEATALREVEEETGLQVKLGPKLGAIEYWFVSGGYRWHKFVHHWLMEPLGGDIADHDVEFDVVQWMPVEEALRVLTYAGEREMVEKAARALGTPV